MIRIDWCQIRYAVLFAALIAGLIAPTDPAHAQLAQPAPAQETEAVPPDIPAEQVEGLIATLEDDQARADLIEQLRLLIAAQQQEDEQQGAVLETLGARILQTLEDRFTALSAQFGAVGAALLDMPKLWDWVRQQAETPASRDRWLAIVTGLAVVLVGGTGGLLLTRLILRRPRHSLERAREEITLTDRLLILLGRTLVDLLPFIVFGLVAYGALAALDPRYVVRLLCVAVTNSILIAAAVLVVARAILTPQVPHLRLVPSSNETSSYLYLWIRRITITCIAGFLVAEIGLTLGMSLGLRNGIRDLIGLVVTGMLIVFMLQNRRPVAAFLGGTGKEQTAAEGAEQDAKGPVILSLRRMVADIWHILAIVYLVIAYGIWALSIEGGFEYMLRATVLSIVILLAAHFVSKLIIQAIHRIFSVSADLKKRDPGLEQRANRYLPILDRIVRALIFIFAMFIVLDVWGLGTLELLRGDFGRRLASSIATIALILAGAFIVWQIVSQIVATQLARAEREGRPPQETQRMRTLLPLLRNAALVILVMIATFMTLSEMGINIAPLLAGAGVVGLAIGFGAQTLVKDVITGLFNIMENTIAIGDVVQVGGHGGLVEGMTIRTVRLRDLSGNVHTVPFSEVTSVMNMTRDFSYYVFDIGVAYRENVDDVIAVVKEIGAGLQKDMPYSALILAPIEILGVDAFADSAVVIKARIKTTPINQWTVGREFNRRMKNRFDELGIEIPFPHMTLYFGEDKAGKAPAAPINLSAPEIVAALARRTEIEEARHQQRRRPAKAEEFETPMALGDEAAESSLGHDGDT